MLTKAGKSLWRALVPRIARMAIHRTLQRSPEFQVRSKLGKPEPIQAGQLVVSGLINESKGVSQAARLTLAGMRHAGFEPLAHDLRHTLSSPADAASGLPFTRKGGAWILHANPPEAVHALRAINPAIWRGRRRIGYWSWELPVAPASWARLSPAFHEIWTPSRFVAESLRAAHVRTPIKVIPHPVALDPPKEARDRSSFQLPEEALIVLSMGDLNSSADRKNLLGAIRIYREAFPSGEGKTLLVVKTQADATHPGFRDSAMDATAGRSDICFVSGTLSQSEVRKLIASSDILLSPHRAEGFGLSLAEAMLMGVPALSTGWSGNLDFMGAIPELLIGYELAPSIDSYGVYTARGQVWAMPRLDDAVLKLKALAASADLRKRLAAAGRDAVLTLSEPWRPGGAIAADLESHVHPLVSGSR